MAHAEVVGLHWPFSSTEVSAENHGHSAQTIYTPCSTSDGNVDMPDTFEAAGLQRGGTAVAAEVSTAFESTCLQCALRFAAVAVFLIVLCFCSKNGCFGNPP